MAPFSLDDCFDDFHMKVCSGLFNFIAKNKNEQVIEHQLELNVPIKLVDKKNSALCSWFLIWLYSVSMSKILKVSLSIFQGDSASNSCCQNECPSPGRCF